MTGTRRVSLAALLLTVGLIELLAAQMVAGQTKAKRPPIKIALASSLFRGVPQALVSASMGPFKVLMEAQTGLRGDVLQGGDAILLGQQLNADKVQLGVFQGFEFAWAQKKFPDLRPLMIAVNQQTHLYVHVLVAKNSDAASFASLKGKTLALPAKTRGHSLLHLERALKTQGTDPAKFFGAVTTPDTAEDALDDVVDGVAQATIVDGVTLDCYQRRKPGRFAKLRNLEKSGAFPAAVVAYHSGGIDDETLQKFQLGLQAANKSAFGRQLLTLWQMTGFEPVPSDYQQTLIDVAKAYPPAEETGASK